MDVFYWHFGLKTEEVNKRLEERQIAIMGVNTISRQLAQTLRAAGMENVTLVDYPLLTNLRLYNDEGELIPSEWPASLGEPVAYKEWITNVEPSELDCLVATSDFGGLQLMRQWNEFCVQNRCNFLPIVLQDLIGYVGPMIVPGETACFECLRARQNSNMEDPDSQRTSEGSAFESQSVVGFHPAMASILGDIAALELTRFYGGWMQSRLGGNLIEVNLIAMQMATRRVLRVPRCRVCGTLNVHGTVSPNKYAFMPGHEVSE
jgi:thiazole/oxazole-forming peptide maturase SagC family component